ncbi:hypothetical protein [Paludisphaera rhizosphaerae]|uniref:hypothetical protein n=1 Tax=Paludisphaera rhizosphaerae TaxID=2711216 RepID=UPI0013EA876F|nr:hypothetical protein [Paludisphaera rhizosphaerae]
MLAVLLVGLGAWQAWNSFPAHSRSPRDIRATLLDPTTDLASSHIDALSIRASEIIADKIRVVGDGGKDAVVLGTTGRQDESEGRIEIHNAQEDRARLELSSTSLNILDNRNNTRAGLHGAGPVGSGFLLGDGRGAARVLFHVDAESAYLSIHDQTETGAFYQTGMNGKRSFFEYRESRSSPVLKLIPSGP